MEVVHMSICLDYGPTELGHTEALLFLVRRGSTDGGELALFLQHPLAFSHTQTAADLFWPDRDWPARCGSARAMLAWNKAIDTLARAAKGGALRATALDGQGALTELRSAHFASYVLEDGCLRLPNSRTPTFTGVLFNAEDVRRLVEPPVLVGDTAVEVANGDRALEAQPEAIRRKGGRPRKIPSAFIIKRIRHHWAENGGDFKEYLPHWNCQARLEELLQDDIAREFDDVDLSVSSTRGYVSKELA